MITCLVRLFVVHEVRHRQNTRLKSIWESFTCALPKIASVVDQYDCDGQDVEGYAAQDCKHVVKVRVCILFVETDRNVEYHPENVAYRKDQQDHGERVDFSCEKVFFDDIIKAQNAILCPQLLD